MAQGIPQARARAEAELERFEDMAVGVHTAFEIGWIEQAGGEQMGGAAVTGDHVVAEPPADAGAEHHGGAVCGGGLEQRRADLDPVLVAGNTAFRNHAASVSRQVGHQHLEAGRRAEGGQGPQRGGMASGAMQHDQPGRRRLRRTPARQMQTVAGHLEPLAVRPTGGQPVTPWRRQQRQIACCFGGEVRIGLPVTHN